MSHRSITDKKLNRLRKAVNRRPLPAYVDLVAWLKDRRYARSTGEAESLILAGRVKSDSHVIGITKARMPTKASTLNLLLGRHEDVEYEEREVVERMIPKARMENVQVLSA